MYRGVVAKAGSVTFKLHSMDQKLGWKGGVWTQYHPVPQGCPFSMKCWPTTGSPSEVHKQCHSALTTPKRHQCQSTTLPIQWYNPLPARVEQYHLHTLNNLSHTDFSQTMPAIPLGSSASLTDAPGFGCFCLANRGALRGASYGKAMKS